MKKKYLLGIFSIALATTLASCGTATTTDAATTPAETETTTVVTSEETLTTSEVAPTTEETPTTSEVTPTTEENPTTTEDEKVELKIERVNAEGTVIEGGYSFDEETKILTITENADGDEYNVSGELSQITCADTLTVSVTINLINATINSGDANAISWTASKKKIIVKAKKDTVNTITSNESAIWSENNIEIGGKGTLNITSGKNAISGSTVEIASGVTINATGTKSAIKGKEVIISDGNLTLSGGTAAIIAEYKKGTTEKGTVDISGGTILLKDSPKGISAQGAFTFSGTDPIDFDSTNVPAIFDCASTTSTSTSLTYKVNGIAEEF